MMLVAQLSRHWRALFLLLIAIVPRVFLLRVYDIELSQDGFEAVRTLNLLQTQGLNALPRDLVDRFILHPLYMLALVAWRILTPASFDFYLSARLLSALFALGAILVLFAFTRRAFGETAAWVSAILLAFAPTFLWESVAILSSTLFLALYLAVLLALLDHRYRLAACLAFLAALTRYEGAVLFALTFLALAQRDRRARKFNSRDWLVGGSFAFAVPFAIIGAGALATGNAFEFVGAQSMAGIWLRFFAPGDFLKRGAFFLTQYPALFPAPVVALGVVGAVIATLILVRSPTARRDKRARGVALLFVTSALYLLFFEILVWFDYTTLEARFLMYPGLPLLVFAGAAIQWFQVSRFNPKTETLKLRTGFLTALLVILSFQQSEAGIRFIYNGYATQHEVADELTRIAVPHQRTNLLVYTGTAGALDLYARQRGLDLTYTDFRFAPDDSPEQYLVERKIQFIVYPVGNAFAKAKYPYLAQFETQTRGAVTFQPLTQFATSLDNQLYSVWAVAYK